MNLNIPLIPKNSTDTPAKIIKRLKKHNMKKIKKDKVHAVHNCMYYRDKGVSCINAKVRSITCIGIRCGQYKRLVKID